MNAPIILCPFSAPVVNHQNIQRCRGTFNLPLFDDDNPKKIDTSRDNGTSCYASIFKHYDESQLHLVLVPEMDKQKEIPFSRFS